MTSINQKTAQVAIVAIAAVLAVSTIAIGNGCAAFAADTATTTITKNVNNTGVNVPTDTAQKQNCVTAGGTYSIVIRRNANRRKKMFESILIGS